MASVHGPHPPILEPTISNALGLFTVVLLILANGFFVAAEFDIVKVRGSQIDIKAREGHPMAKLSRHIIVNLDEYLSATQLGITVIDEQAFLQLLKGHEQAHE